MRVVGIITGTLLLITGLLSLFTPIMWWGFFLIVMGSLRLIYTYYQFKESKKNKEIIEQLDNFGTESNISNEV